MFFSAVPSRRSIAILFCVCLLPAIPARSAPPAGMEPIIEEYRADQGSVSEFYDLPWSPRRFDRLDGLLHDWQRRIRALDFDALDHHARVDYLLLRTRIGAGLDNQTTDRKRLEEIAELIPFREQIQSLEAARWRLEPVDAEHAAARLAELPDQIRKLRERIEQGKKAQAETKKEKDGTARAAAQPPAGTTRQSAGAEPARDGPPALRPSPILAQQAASAVGSLRQSLRTWFTFYDGFTPEFSWWVRKPHEAADKALEEYAKLLREEIAGLHGKDEDPLVGYPIGEDALKRLLAAEMIAYTPQEIVSIGERQLAWCGAQMRQAAREMGCGDDWKAALARVKSRFAPPGRQDDLVAEQAREAIRFVKDRDLITVPALCEETWRLTMTAPEAQKTMPYAAYGGQEMTVAYASESMKHDDKLMAMRGNNRYFTRIVTAHELIPGHHLERTSPAGIAPTGASSPRLSLWRAGACTGKCGSGTWVTRKVPRIVSACSSGG